MVCSDVLYCKRNMRNMSEKSSGFTLVELLVVIAIISVLAGVLVVAINPAAILAKGRDTKRMDDLDNLHKAILLALAEEEITLIANSNDSVNGTQSVGDGDADNVTDGYVAVGIPTGMTGIAKYIPMLPVDPLHPTAAYSYSSDGTYFELNCVLESPDNATKMAVDGGNNNDVYEVGSRLTLIN